MAINVINLEVESNEAIAFVGDLHADSATPSTRKDDYLNTVVGKLSDIHSKCVKNNVKAVFFSGDIFSRIQVTNECIKVIGRQFRRFSNSGIFIGTIIGNHDIARNQINKLEKSPLSVLFEFGILEYLRVDNRVAINKSTLITPVSFLEDPVRANSKASHNILLAHMFYNASDLIASDNDNLKEEHVKLFGYDAIFLGHDHVDYDIVEVENTSIVRPGSVTRGTSHNYNFNRKVGFYILKDPGNYKKSNWEFIDIEVLPMEDIISSLVLNRRSNLANLSSMITDLVSKLSSNGSSGPNRSIFDIVSNSEELPSNIRVMLLDYFKEAGIYS